jgi:hypothetical protein
MVLHYRVFSGGNLLSSGDHLVDATLPLFPCGLLRQRGVINGERCADKRKKERSQPEHAERQFLMAARTELLAAEDSRKKNNVRCCR